MLSSVHSNDCANLLLSGMVACSTWTQVPPRHYHSLCRFDFEKDLKKALNYRDAEVRFVWGLFRKQL
jgi:hypothetical protein